MSKTNEAAKDDGVAKYFGLYATVKGSSVQPILFEAADKIMKKLEATSKAPVTKAVAKKGDKLVQVKKQLE